MTIYYVSWFIIALICLIVEINAMTFYLLALAIGALTGGSLAYFEYDFTTQLTAAGIVTIISAAGSHYLRKKLKSPNDRKNNQLDMGQRVQVHQSAIAADGTAHVDYRGAQWQAYKENEMLTPGVYVIARLDGARIVLGDKIGDAQQVDDANKYAASAEQAADSNASK